MNYQPEEMRKDLIIKRVINLDINLREASKQIGISYATLSRIENNNSPDVDTFAKLCTWLNTEPNKYFK